MKEKETLELTKSMFRDDVSWRKALSQLGIPSASCPITNFIKFYVPTVVSYGTKEEKQETEGLK